MLLLTCILYFFCFYIVPLTFVVHIFLVPFREELRISDFGSKHASEILFKLYRPDLENVISIGPVIGEAINLEGDHIQYPVLWREGCACIPIFSFTLEVVTHAMLFTITV